MWKRTDAEFVLKHSEVGEEAQKRNVDKAPEHQDEGLRGNQEEAERAEGGVDGVEDESRSPQQMKPSRNEEIAPQPQPDNHDETHCCCSCFPRRSCVKDGERIEEAAVEALDSQQAGPSNTKVDQTLSTNVQKVSVDHQAVYTKLYFDKLACRIALPSTGKKCEFRALKRTINRDTEIIITDDVDEPFQANWMNPSTPKDRRGMIFFRE